MSSTTEDNGPLHMTTPFDRADSDQRSQPTAFRRKPVPQKPQFAIDYAPVSSHEHQGSQSPQDLHHVPSSNYQGHPWQPGTWRQFPILGALSLIGAFLGVVGCIIILLVSDGDRVDHWTFSPTVWIALLTAMTNVFTRYAFDVGVNISWWHKAIRGGTVRDLRDRWEQADNAFAAALAGRRSSFVSVASIAATLIVINQPLIQRASTVRGIRVTEPVNVTAFIAPEIPLGYTGWQALRSHDDQLMKTPMTHVMNEYNQNRPIASGFRGCKGTCTGHVDAGGLAARCSSITGPVAQLDNANEGAFEVPFGVNFTLSAGEWEISPPVITMSVAYTKIDPDVSTDVLPGCRAIRTERVCELSSATIRYPIRLDQNGILTLGNLSEAEVRGIQPPVQVNLIDSGGTYSHWTLGGLFTAAKVLFTTEARFTSAASLNIYLTVNDALSNQFLQPADSNNTAKQDGDEPPSMAKGRALGGQCEVNWMDPTAFILNALNELSLRLSILGRDVPYRDGTDPAPVQMLAMQQTTQVNVFRSDLRFLISSAVLSIVFILLVTPTYRGWSELGRQTTLNPIETAKAFDAPLLSGPGSNAPVDKLVQMVGHRAVRLGSVDTRATGPDQKGHITLLRMAMKSPEDSDGLQSGKIYW